MCPQQHIQVVPTNIAKVAVQMVPLVGQWHNLGNYHKMCKNGQNHRALVIMHTNKDHAWAIGRGARLKNLRQSTPSAIQKWKHHVAPATHLGKQMGRARNATLGDLRATLKH